MPDQPLPNNPYARPVHATRPEGQMLQGEYYGQRAGDKTLSHETGGRKVSPANRYSGRAVATPVDMDTFAPPKVVVREPEFVPDPHAPPGLGPQPPEPPKRKPGRPLGSKDKRPRLSEAQIEANREAMIARIEEDDLFG